MMSPLPPDIERLVRHRASMLLIDKLVEASDVHALGEVRITEASSFYRRGRGVPAYVGLEYMAQTVAAFDGARRIATGEAPAVGFLLGTRRYKAEQGYFRAGEILSIRTQMVFSENGMAAFDCSISVEGEVRATAALNVYRPESGVRLQDGME
jgi:predicted hotdog family 3-hydroxylacyl-ACP dehydratase